MPDRDAIKEQVRDATDIVRLIGEHISVKPKGREFVCLCPFHDDTKPSMSISPSKQIYKCFACGAGGDVFSFVMNYMNRSFPEAMEYLADRANIELPAFQPGGRSDGSSGPSPRQRILEANKRAVQFYRNAYSADIGSLARDYVTARGISDEMVEQFAIGYAPDEWEALSNEIARRRWDREAFEMAGLIASRNNGPGHFDRLRHRLIIPIFDGTGRPIAFGGRYLEGSKRDDKSDAKYLNSPETRVFNKSETLFGLHVAQRPIIRAETAVIVEGYTDVIACHQHGVDNVVATLGTALTADHARKLRNYANRVILVFDADEAGQRAADRALQVFFNEPIDVAIAVLPGEADPADLLSEPNGVDRWHEAMDAARDAMAFHFDRVRGAFDAETTITGKQRIAEDYLRNLAELGFQRLDPMRKSLVLPRIAELLGLDVPTVKQMLDAITARGGGRRRFQSDRAKGEAQPAGDPEAAATDARSKAERVVVGCLLAMPGLFEFELADGRPLHESLVPEEFGHAPARSVYKIVYERLLDGEPVGLSDLRESGGGETIVRLATSMLFDIENRAGADEQAITSTLIGAAETLQEYLRREAYEARRAGVTGPTPTPDASPEAEGGGDDAKMQAMLDALAHARSRRTIRRGRRSRRPAATDPASTPTPPGDSASDPPADAAAGPLPDSHPDVPPDLPLETPLDLPPEYPEADPPDPPEGEEY